MKSITNVYHAHKDHNLTIKPIHAHVPTITDMMLKQMLAYQSITAQILSNGMVSDADAPTTSSHGPTDVEHAQATQKPTETKLHVFVTTTGNLMDKITDVSTHVNKMNTQELTMNAYV